MRIMGTFVLMFALPALIIRAFSQRQISEVLDPGYLMAYGIGSLAVLGVGLAAMRWGLKAPMGQAAISALGMAGSNSGFVGYPLVALVIGPTAGVALALNMLVENVLIIPIALALAESSLGNAQSWRATLAGIFSRLIRSPMIVAILIGMLISLSGLKLPGPVAKTIDMMAMASGPVALFVIGGTLHGLKLGGMVGNLNLIMLGKLVLHPLAVLAALQLFPAQSHELHMAAVLMAAAPMVSIYPLLGQRFGQEKLCAAALLAATTASFITLSLALALMR
jgi:predicted permease